MFGHQGVTAYYCGFCQKIVQYRPEISTILNVPIGNRYTLYREECYVSHIADRASCITGQQTCAQCINAKNIHIRRYTDFHVWFSFGLRSQADISIQALVDEVFAKDPLEDWRCELCQNKHGETHRSTRMSKLPAFLVVHLVRGVISPRGELIRSKRKVCICPQTNLVKKKETRNRKSFP